MWAKTVSFIKRLFGIKWERLGCGVLCLKCSEIMVKADYDFVMCSKWEFLEREKDYVSK